jgi:predicted MFS family arabinose efflux permease
MGKNLNSINVSNDQIKRGMLILAAISAFVGIYQGFSEAILANYFFEAYHVSAEQRGFIELPRELPGVLSLFVISALSFLRDIRTAIIAQIFGAVGMMVLGLFHPTFGVMLVFLFVYSLGLHMYIPLGDSIPLSMSQPTTFGRTLGRLNSMKMAAMMLAGVATFLGFRSGVFAFGVPVLAFVICAASFAVVGVLLFWLYRTVGDRGQSKDASKLVWKKAYIRYYVICALYGGRKQIMIVFSPWLLIELLGFRADTMSILAVIGAFIGVFFIPAIGKMIDLIGVRKVMMFEAGAFIAVYVAYGFLAKQISESSIAVIGLALVLVFALIIIDKMAQQFYIARSIYMKAIAVVPEDVTPSLSTGMAIDHVLAIIGSFACGVVWDRLGPEYVFLIAGILSFANMIVAAGIKKQNVVSENHHSH